MDFLDFENHDLYFDEELSLSNELLLKKAADLYPNKESETILMKLHVDLPDNLTIIVALYRFYYYQHRYQDALYMARRALAVSASILGLYVDWPQLTEKDLGEGVFVSMGLIRFYMLALKASAYLLLRIGEIEQAHARLKKIVELDPADQFGASFLFKMAEREMSYIDAEQHNITSLFYR